MTGNRTVLLTVLVSFGTFVLAGPQAIAKLGNVQRYLVGEGKAETPAANQSVFSPRSLFGWALMFVMLTILADFDATSDLAASFATLIMLTTLLALGPDALSNVQSLTKGTS